VTVVGHGPCPIVTSVNLGRQELATLRLAREIEPVLQDISSQVLRVAATRAASAAQELIKTIDVSITTDIDTAELERLRTLQALERGLRSGKADLIALLAELEKVDREIADTAERLAIELRKLEYRLLRTGLYRSSRSCI
jgi:hypothetical protein